MTPLKKPIVVTITHVENAVLTALCCEESFNRSDDRHALLERNYNRGEFHSQLIAALKAQGVDYKTWSPPQPLRVGQYEVEALEGGAIKVGCTTVDRPTLEAILKLSSEAMVKEEPEWPKWYRKQRGHDVIRFDDETSFGTWITNGLDDGKSEIYTYEGMCAGHYSVTFYKITPAQAREILEAKG